MSQSVKTPSRRRVRSEVKTPLTPSLLTAFNAVTIDSPIKRATSTTVPVNDALHRQASSGVIRKGAVESRIDVVTLDYVPPAQVKRSRSTPAINRAESDRFITARDPTLEVSATLDQMSLNPSSGSPTHTARLAAATGVPLNRRILGYHLQPPSASSDSTLALQREFVRPLYANRPGAIATSTGSTTNKTRKIATQPERVLDAPGLVDDFYLNLLSWSSLNCVAVALEASTYIWKADTGAVVQMGEAPAGTYVGSVSFSNDGAFLGIGLGNGDVELWDGHVPVLSWWQHLLSSGCEDGSVWHHDVRVPRHKVMEMLGHSGGVCGLEWRKDGELIASGGNDNVVNIWDARVGDSGPPVGGDGVATGHAKWTKRNHTAAVKALAWSPWQLNLLASGGGTNDATINVWNSTTGARLHTVTTPSQITSLHFAPHRKELLTTHGYPTNAIGVWTYPGLERVAEIRDAHDSRVLFSAVSPGGDMVVTGAGDESLKFWRIWDLPSGEGKKGKANGGRENSVTRSGVLSIR
ncbi:WD40-repeat-containing domain protein [Roridomyces roridus]|uniref:WD40-repeat-containing domain protein n=1 Tax=Roridomyces roridus TaxID=1738132 RepID=A0AAD7BWA3_9AGAR|nr:WD40-repeat-containing domain protein [Roridomyces roridus]